ncbi:MAG: Gfo/Idh/MocA family oxidoreductase, partial [Planctomycetota bacterium]
MEDKRIKVAVIGVGHLGKEHARVYSQLPDVELVGVVDTDRERGEQV